MTTIREILTVTCDALDAWARKHGGRAEIAGDPAHLFALLSHGPGAVRACIMLRRELKRGEHEEAGYVDRTFIVTISRGRGFTLEPSDALIRQTTVGAPLFDLAEEARDIVRAIDYPLEDTDWTVDYQSTDLFEFPTENPVDAYQLTFSIGCQLPAA
jgi:hypothetical protein